jgi:hypothetical protein
MMYRCGWATKPGQERVLAVRLPRAAFNTVLASAVPAGHDPEPLPREPRPKPSTCGRTPMRPEERLAAARYAHVLAGTIATISQRPDTSRPARWRGLNLLGFALMDARDHLATAGADR